jgi:hypothetical protein
MAIAMRRSYARRGPVCKDFGVAGKPKRSERGPAGPKVDLETTCSEDSGISSSPRSRFRHLSQLTKVTLHFRMSADADQRQRARLQGEHEPESEAYPGLPDAASVQLPSVHVEVNGLEPGRWYHYRFRTSGVVSPIGRTRTAPAPGADLSTLRSAFASCQHFERGLYTAYQHMVNEDIELVISWATSSTKAPQRPVDYAST